MPGIKGIIEKCQKCHKETELLLWNDWENNKEWEICQDCYEWELTRCREPNCQEEGIYQSNQESLFCQDHIR